MMGSLVLVSSLVSVLLIFDVCSMLLNILLVLVIKIIVYNGLSVLLYKDFSCVCVNCMCNNYNVSNKVINSVIGVLFNIWIVDSVLLGVNMFDVSKVLVMVFSEISRKGVSRIISIWLKEGVVLVVFVIDWEVNYVGIGSLNVVFVYKLYK